MIVEKKSNKRKLEGVVVSNKANKTIVVEVLRRYKHPIYGKFVTSNKKYHAHDETNKAKEGDKVVIIEAKPISKLKKWELFTIN
jgi:small subunit ribosomal protein S17